MKYRLAFLFLIYLYFILNKIYYLTEDFYFEYYGEENFDIYDQ